MVKVEVISDKPNKRILRCSEGNRIWMEELEMYYTFFYEIRNGRRVLGKDRIKEILDILL